MLYAAEMADYLAGPTLLTAASSEARLWRLGSGFWARKKLSSSNSLRTWT